MNLAPAVLPAAPLRRVNSQPEMLPPIPRPDAGPGRNRWDSPDGSFRVRYLASTLRGCFVELMSRFRDDPATEALLAAVEGIDGVPGPDHAKVDGVAEWLEQQRVGTAIVDGSPLIVDIDRAEFLTELNKHHRVRQALDASPLSAPNKPAELDFAVIRLTAPLGRPITQAVSAAIREDYPGVGGLRYASRLDTTEECWALYEETPVIFESVAPLSPADVEHAQAVRSAAGLLQVALPDAWS